MEMTLRHQNTMLSIRQLLGWPLFKPMNDAIAFCSGREIDFEVGSELARIATAERKDLVYSGWASETAAEPESFAVIYREILTVDLIDHLVPYVANDEAPLVFVSTRADEIIAVDRRGSLIRIPGKPKSIGKGRRLAMKRIKAGAKVISDQLLQNNRIVPHGGWIEPEAPTDTIVKFG